MSIYLVDYNRSWDDSPPEVAMTFRTIDEAVAFLNNTTLMKANKLYPEHCRLAIDIELRASLDQSKSVLERMKEYVKSGFYR